MQVEIELGISCPNELPDVQLQEFLYYFGALDEKKRELLLGIAKVIADETECYRKRSGL